MTAEPFYTDANGKKGDTLLHSDLLGSVVGALASELAAIRMAVAGGLEFSAAALIYGSAGTLDWLRYHGYSA